MQYTPNYHLPQWVESDRIMMDDFNQMCRNIENGLSDRSQAVDSLAGQISNVSSSLSGEISQRALEGKTFDRFCLAAYNHYHLAKHCDPFPRQMGVFHQSFASEDATVPGMTRREECCYMGKGPKTLSVKEFYDSMVVESYMVVNKDPNVSPLSIRFTATMPGILKQLRLSGRHYCDVAVPGKGMCQLTFTNLTTGVTEVSNTFSLNMGTNVDSRSPKNMAVNVTFHPGYEYRLKIEPLSSNYVLNYVPMYDENFLVELLDLPSASITQSLSGDPSNGGIALVRYLTYADGGTITLHWNNANIPAYKTRTITEDGKTYLETEFRQNTPLPENNTLRLDLSCTNGEIALYSWGASLI